MENWLLIVSTDVWRLKIFKQKQMQSVGLHLPFFTVAICVYPFLCFQDKVGTLFLQEPNVPEYPEDRDYLALKVLQHPCFLFLQKPLA